MQNELRGMGKDRSKKWQKWVRKAKAGPEGQFKRQKKKKDYCINE